MGCNRRDDDERFDMTQFSTTVEHSHFYHFASNSIPAISMNEYLRSQTGDSHE